jgi:heme/copper-type cytochrome/quinol oxidase subunit 2
MQSWFPENVSTYGGDVDGIFWFIFYIVTVWFFLTEGLILYFIFRYRRKPGRTALDP